MSFFGRQGRRTALLAAVVVAVVAVVAQTAGAQTWDCGETPGAVTATLSGGTLTVSGAGKMKDYVSGSDTTRGNFIGSVTKIVIEDGITSIGDNMFNSCTSLTSIAIPSSVTSIGSGAFMSCKNLTFVDIPKGVRSIGNYAFQGCSALTSVVIPELVTSIEEGTFYACRVLSLVTIPNSVTSIGRYAFENCVGVTSILIPNSVTVIGGYSFKNSGLTSVTIPNSVTTIELATFAECAKLTSVTISNSITSIGETAFESCNNLTSITIPGNVTSIGDRAFGGCNKLTSIISLSDIPPTISSMSFLFLNISACLYVIESSVEAYKSAEYWKNFTCINTIQAATIASNPRTVGIAVPPLNAKEATIAPLGNEFTIGPNPVDKSFGTIKFFRNGSHIASASLSVYNASGDVVKNIAIYDNDPISNNSKRSVGLWDLTDMRGRQVSAGTYLVKGVFKTSNGTRETVSAVVGVRYLSKQRGGQTPPR